jgi:hypothetical protein
MCTGNLKFGAHSAIEPSWQIFKVAESLAMKRKAL